ncbi:heat shock factor protein 5-like [Neopsephotus bourkii]|uniref:heat shock factor protein 5-like n=1 Tax=Neopsephotus bourkii TaxID=309878 RepID=UPI002AA58D67|nr:heat shock factor protein 5-like [Neopsephotus bourkii]
MQTPGPVHAPQSPVHAAPSGHVPGGSPQRTAIGRRFPPGNGDWRLRAQPLGIERAVCFLTSCPDFVLGAEGAGSGRGDRRGWGTGEPLRARRALAVLRVRLCRERGGAGAGGQRWLKPVPCRAARGPVSLPQRGPTGPGVAWRPVQRERPVRPLSGSAMEGQRLPGVVNPSHFPAKLWQLVNSPRCGSVRWDARGEGLLIDQRLFERELLGAEAAGDGAALAAEFFKTKNFGSIIRQLNLYGFHKLGPGPGPLQDPAGGDCGSSAGALLHFYSPHFRRDRPELLVHLKRRTSANKAKLAAGLELPSRPAQLSQCSPSTLGEAARPGLVTSGEAPQPCPDSCFPSCNRAASCQNHPAFQETTSQQPPAPSRTWQGSVGSLPGHWASPAFPGQGAPFPVLNTCCTEVTYTLQTVCSLLPLQRWAPAGAALPEPGSCASPGQCLQGRDPTLTLQCSPPAQGGPLTLSGSATAAASTDCFFVQSPEVQPPAAECLPSDGAQHASEDEDKLPELSYEDVFQFFSEMYASRSADAVTLKAAESWNGELFESCHNAAIGIAAAADTAQDFVTTQRAPDEQREELDHNPAQPSKMFVLEGLFSAEQENGSLKCGKVTGELTLGTEVENKAAEEAGSPAKPQCRKRRRSSEQDRHEPEGGAWKRGCFWRETPE